jgi:DNA polymerase III delta prime subunit
MNFRQKYAPTSLANVVFEDANVAKTIGEYANGMRSGGLLLHGPNGTGKSTIALLMAQKSLSDNSVDDCWLSIVHANADDIEKKIEGMFTNARWQELGGSTVPIGIVEEADLLSLRLQYRIRQHLDASKSTIVLTCNEPQRIANKLYSRCRRAGTAPEAMVARGAANSATGECCAL